MHASETPQPVALPERIAIFTDFDGTLVDIAPTPDSISPPPDLAEELATISRALHGAFAILTGRRIADIDRYIGAAALPIAGSHGAERRRADGSLEAIGPDLESAATAIARALAPLALQHPELIVEAKPAAVALHYRQAPQLGELCLNAITRVVASFPDFMVLRGKMVLEARPRRASKGEALKAFMQEAPFAGRLPLFIGDDTTDEDGFVAAQALGGVGVKLGEGETAARLRIDNVAAVHRLFSDIAGQADGAAEPAPEPAPVSAPEAGA